MMINRLTNTRKNCIINQEITTSSEKVAMQCRLLEYLVDLTKNILELQNLSTNELNYNVQYIFMLQVL